MPTWTQSIVRAPVNLAIRSAYAIYLRTFSGAGQALAVSERIVEYPFAVRHLRQLPAGSRIAVAGCYGDLLTTLLPALGQHVVGIDIKTFPIEYPDFSFHQSDLRQIDLPDASFDAVVAISTIEHVGLFDGDPTGDAKAVREFRRLLKPGGMFVATVPFAATASVIEMNQRIYDRASLTELLADFKLSVLSTYAYQAEKSWTEVPVEGVPPASSWAAHHCTAAAVALVPK